MEAVLFIKGPREDPSSMARRMAWIDWLKTHDRIVDDISEFRVMFIHNMGGEAWVAIVEGPASNVLWHVTYDTRRLASVVRLVQKRFTTYAVRNEDEHVNPIEREKNTAYNDHTTP